MRLKSDEQAVLLQFAENGMYDGDLLLSRLTSILKKFETHGFLNGDEITARGLHVASKLTPTQQETAPNGDIHGQPESYLEPQPDGAVAEEDQGTSLDRVDEPGIGPDAEASKRPDDSGGGGLSDL